MCGLAGFIDSSLSLRSDELKTIVLNMTKTLRHRGPDDEGFWTDASMGVSLGHRRLSIIDLSSEGSQPMASQNGRYILIFNGEIYNFEQLRDEIKNCDNSFSYQFRGRSDTEVMLATFERFGVVESLSRFNGMFAFACWDRTERTLYLSRDRVGEKPLYYGWAGKSLIFGSELSSLKSHPDFNTEVDREVMSLYLKFGYIPSPYSIYRNIFKLPPGTYIAFKDFSPHKFPAIERYWELDKIVDNGISNPFSGSETDITEKLEFLLRTAIKSQMVSDVPIGAFLSGGVDSSTVVALMQAQSSSPIKTFTIGIHDSGYNEATYAAKIAKHLGTDHTELYVTSQHAMDVIPRIPELYDEPFADSSQIPTFLVSQLAKEKVTVCLSGDGGDELFGGYNRYIICQDIWNKIGWLPKPIRTLGAFLLRLPRHDQWDSFAKTFGFIFSKYGTLGTFGDKFQKLAEVLTMPNRDELYLRLMTHWANPKLLIEKGGLNPNFHGFLNTIPTLANATQRMMFFDFTTYLPDDILTKVDRASMGNSLEARVPMLDPEVIKFAWQIPHSMKFKNGQSKWPLKRILNKYVPMDLIERPKMGFGVPVNSWLRGPLRGWAEDLINSDRLKREGFFDPEPIRAKWKEHLTSKRQWHFCLWTILMFQAWLENESSQ